MKFEELSADLDSQPITGYLPDGRYIDIPLISHVEDNLYVGGCMNGVDLGDYFSHVFSLYIWEKYKVHADTQVHDVKMYDSRTDPVDVEGVERLSDAAVKALEAGGNVLIHCQAGINRSNLTAARVLMKWKGLTAREAIDMLRDARSPLVLANTTFENYLLSLDD